MPYKKMCLRLHKPRAFGSDIMTYGKTCKNCSKRLFYDRDLGYIHHQLNGCDNPEPEINFKKLSEIEYIDCNKIME